MAGLAPFDDVTLVHCVRWQDNNIAQISHSHLGYPAPATSAAMKIWSDNGGHVSIAGPIEMQMRHGMPPFQLALNHGILPSLSPDVDTNMTPDPFSLMRGAFTLQRGLANDLGYTLKSDPGNLPIPQLLTCRQAVEMMTIAGAAGSGLLKKLGTLTPGKEADIVILDYDNINTPADEQRLRHRGDHDGYPSCEARDDRGQVRLLERRSRRLERRQGRGQGDQIPRQRPQAYQRTGSRQRHSVSSTAR